MEYKIIVLDLDGTLTNRDKVITPRTKRALMEAQEAGKIVVLAFCPPPARRYPQGDCKGTGTVKIWKLYFVLQWGNDYQLPYWGSGIFFAAPGGIQPKNYRSGRGEWGGYPDL